MSGRWAGGGQILNECRTNARLHLLLPEAESSPDSVRLAQSLAAAIGISTQTEDITPILNAAGCYRRLDEAIQKVVSSYGDGYKCKLALPAGVDGASYPVFSIVVQSPDGSKTKTRLTYEAYLGIVAATDVKRRTRKKLEYYYVVQNYYPVAEIPNRLEYDQGFFVKNGDGAAVLKPIAHLYKSQVYQLAAYLGIPEEICRQSPTTETYPLEQSQEEFCFSMPLATMDLCMYGKNNGIPAAGVAAALRARMPL